MLLFALTIFLSAFLLFQVQPIIAKIILPWFGGSSAVWSSCMLFFQAVLLLGYLYSHLLHEKLTARKQAIVHSLLLMVSLGALFALSGASSPGVTSGNPSWQILKLLGATIGLPYFMLSTTTPLLQAWYARSRARAMPYRLYALSNLASMLALLTYPVLVEPNLSVRRQTGVWSGLYLGFALLCGTVAWFSLGRRDTEAVMTSPEEEAEAVPVVPRWDRLLLWVLLPACASILLLSTTSYLTQDVAVIPFLWILPLSLYLLSFIICFETPRLYWRPVYYPLVALALWAMGYVVYWRDTTLEAMPTIALCGAALFIFCMMCHGELARAKPAARYLTLFYVMVSIGGALGGLLVAVVAPNLFNSYYEFPAGLVLCACLGAAVLLKENQRFLMTRWGWLTGTAAFLLLGVYTVALARGMHEVTSGCRVVARNFYGQLRVLDDDEEDGLGRRRKLMHGLIDHGEQFQSEKNRRLPSTYYCPGTGIADLLADGQEGVPRRIGMIGLGCGTLTVYGRKGDIIRLYEINPLVIRLARTEFTFLADTPAEVETVLGDGRLMLEREPDQHFDFIIVDAFSGDSIPVHLLTREAFQTYFRHLKPDGILGVHISNKYLDLKPVVQKAASYFGKVALLFDFEADDKDTRCFNADWVLVMTPEARNLHAALLGKGQVIAGRPHFRMWTDDYSGMFGILN